MKISFFLCSKEGDFLTHEAINFPSLLRDDAYYKLLIGYFSLSFLCFPTSLDGDRDKKYLYAPTYLPTWLAADREKNVPLVTLFLAM